jgi:hypothetical protein
VLATATARWRLGRAAERRGTLGEGQQEGARAVGKLGDDAWRLGEAGGSRAAWHGGQRRRCYAAEGEAEEEESGGAPGAYVQFQKFQSPRCKTRFLTILYLK